MINVTPSKLLNFANQSMAGQTLHTLARHAPFKVDVKGEEFIFTPQGGEPLDHGGKYLQAVCERFNKTHSLSPSDYKSEGELQGSVFANYTLSVIIKYLASIVDNGKPVA